MKSILSVRALSIALMLSLVLGLTSCGSTLNNENDWAMNKGASANYIPRSVSKKVYR